MTQIGRYDIVRKTGIHGLSAVYEAFDKQMQRPVTIHIAERRPTDPGGFEERARQAIRSQAQQLAELHHPNIVKVLSCEEVEGTPLLVLEQFEGRPLREILKEQSRLAPEQVSKILAAAAAGLDHAHSKGLQFRHLSPANLLVSEEGLVKITGFESVSRQMDPEPADEELSLILDALPYLSPELLRGDLTDAQADQFSLAAIGLEALTGVAPSNVISPIEQMEQGLFEQLPIADRLGSEWPRGLAAVFQRALSKNPSGRYPSCADFVAAFDAGLAGKGSPLTRVVLLDAPDHAPPGSAAAPLEAYTPGELRERLAQGAPRSLAPWIVATAVVVVLAAVGAFFLLRAPVSNSKATAQPVPPVPAATPPPVAPPPLVAAKKETRASKATQPRAVAAKKKQEVIPEVKPEPETPVETDTRSLRPKVRLADQK